MPATMQPIREDIDGSELPEYIRQKAHIAPGEIVTITIQPKAEDSLADMLSVLERSGAEAQARGLTDDTLADLLKDES
jgi:hypothetical protein